MTTYSQLAGHGSTVTYLQTRQYKDEALQGSRYRVATSGKSHGELSIAM